MMLLEAIITDLRSAKAIIKIMKAADPQLESVKVSRRIHACLLYEARAKARLAAPKSPVDAWDINIDGVDVFFDRITIDGVYVYSE